MNGSGEERVDEHVAHHDAEPWVPADVGDPRPIACGGCSSRRTAAVGGAAGPPPRSRTGSSRQLMPNAHTYPPMLITSPASVGPTTRPRFHCALDSSDRAHEVRRRHEIREHGLVGGEADRLGTALGEDDQGHDRGARVTGRSEDGEQRRASTVWTAIVVNSSALRGNRSASSAADRTEHRTREESGGGDEPGPAGVVGLRSHVDADADRLHPRADVREERADPEGEEDPVPEGRERPGPAGGEVEAAWSPNHRAARRGSVTGMAGVRQPLKSSTAPGRRSA